MRPDMKGNFIAMSFESVEITDIVKLRDPVPLIWVVKMIGKQAGRPDNLARKMRDLGYPIVKLGGKNHCERAHAVRMFPQPQLRSRLNAAPDDEDG